ncbi:hypothetical protein M409DRAFT_23860 [Zasmidium cellare ATCC 36951]|uniref:Transcription factor domain-containing protein n=1 Tax=Zasmidium cellare ATCC 36951 TaxID=1080233 RepID=A0A6A6CEC9_ZASCE|nr:uncharacterized protein M409DRAFT_23860 [Zasmidium cellare ATCC 36951]KAF2165564.1 hypothetical protein M409DRAFT_23860 [Zasmidium cellare ATCC 36951]
MSVDAPRIKLHAAGAPAFGHEDGPPWCLGQNKQRQRKFTKNNLNRSLAPANNRAIRNQLWAVYTLEYKRGVRNCWIDALATADATPAVIGNTFDALVRCNIAAADEKNASLKYQARDAYGRALSTLAHSLGTLPADMMTNKHNTQGILIGMLLVGLCQWQVLDSCGEGGQASWTLHYKASQNFVKALGPGAFDTNDDLDMNLLQVTWFLNFLSSLALRRRMTLDLKTWDSFSAAMCEGPRKEVFGFLRSWFRMMVPIPRRLEEIDSILTAAGGQDQGLKPAMRKLVDFSSNAEVWAIAKAAPVEYDVAPEGLDMSIEEHFFLSINTAFRRQYRFLRQEMAMMWLVTWFSRLITDCTALRAVIVRPEVFTNQPDLDPTRLEQNAYLAAISLARSVYSVSQLSNVTYATILKTLLEILAAFFAERGAMQELSWCQGCKAATEIRLQRLQRVRPRTLCRIEEMVPQLIAAVSIRTRLEALPKLPFREQTMRPSCPLGYDGDALP